MITVYKHLWTRVIGVFLASLLMLLAGCGDGEDAAPSTATVAASISAQPVSQSVVSGSGASFSVSASGDNLAYQWQRSTDGGATWANIAGATAATYTIAAVDATTSGYQYRAVVTGTANSVTTSAVTLSVAPAATAPAIDVQPAPLSATAGTNAMFTVTATGTSLRYQWQTSPDRSTWTDINGATNASLSLPSVAIADSGKLFRVNVSNSAGSVTSNSASLTVTPAPAVPQFITQPLPVSVTAPQAATFSVVATAAPPPSYQWQQSVNGGTSYADIAGATSAAYTTPATALADSGTLFRVRVYNSAGDVFSTSVLLSVNIATAAPTIATQPASKSVTQPDTATFSVTATGAPTPTYQWQVSADGGTTFLNINGASSNSYTTPTTLGSDNGKQFRVVVSNIVGSATSNAATLAVIVVPPSFTALTPTMGVGRAAHTATLLPNGKVLIAGGFSSNTFPGPALNTAELYDPLSNSFTALSATMRSVRTNHTATLLPNGQVLLTGGQDNNDGDGLNTAELYDPTTQTFTAITATMASPRGGHAATLLPDGKVLLTGGFNGGPGTLLSDAELYDPTTKIFTALGARMAVIRDQHRATLLPNGKVLLTGGLTSKVIVNTAELYDPTTRTFTALTATMTSIRAAHEATLLPNGLVLVTGGAMVFSPTNSTLLDTAELYNPTTQTFTAIAAKMTVPRAVHAATLLPNGAVLLTGGVRTIVTGGAPSVLNNSELYKP